MRRYRLVVYFAFLYLQIHAKTIIYDDHIYEPEVQTIIFYLDKGEITNILNPPIAHLQQSYPLVLEFDHHSQSVSNFYYKVVHCNADWTPSVLMDSEYLKEFINDYLITQYQISFNTRAKYVHYKLTVPAVKISGNYLLMVYQNNNTEDVILTRRFVIFENRISINPDFRISQGIDERMTHQQIDFTISYKSYNEIFNLSTELQVVIRQNYRWDNAIYNLPPLYVKDNDKILDYHYFNLENNFPGGNEFRMFDTRRIRNNAINIEKIDFLPTGINVYIMQEKSRNYKAYSQMFDMNGRFVPYNNEAGGNFTDPDYTNVIFNLKTSEMPYGNIYVIGLFNNWRIDEKYMLKYDNETDSYKCSLFLKQGVYDYIYAVKSPKTPKSDEIALEGSHFQTENIYDIIVYHRPIGARSDFVIGYIMQKFNPQY
ncbi:MAG: DUF5103 domain-containing protein [Cytophagales bacterium]|nr:DUF5103 domain-containing protein [Cytophagales bacterium]